MTDMTMTAMQLVAPGDAHLVTVPRPEAGPGEALLRVLAVGLCRTDLHIRSAADSRTPNGTILGHEIAGEIAALPTAGGRWQVGDRVIVHPCFACGQCRACRAGDENYCHAPGRLAPPCRNARCSRLAISIRRSPRR